MRNKSELFDINHESYFNESKRIRIVEFLLKRKRFSENVEDDFAFGIDKLISNEVYSAAYPVHDGLIEEKGIYLLQELKCLIF